jgi:hypothetical protein
VSHPDAADSAGAALFLEPRKVVPPGDEVVDLFDLDLVVPAELGAELLPPLVHGRRPDLRRDVGADAPAVERGPERGL